MLRLALAGVAGFLLGLISNRKDRTHSSRVFAIVSIISALLFIVASGLHQQTHNMGDPARLTAQILSALGFLFAGLIWIDRSSRVEGLNTAAALMLASLIGLLIGAGCYLTALLGVVFFLLLYWLSSWIKPRRRRKIVQEKTGEEAPPVDAGSSNSRQLSGTDASFSYFNGFGNHVAAIPGTDIAPAPAGYNLINT